MRLILDLKELGNETKRKCNQNCIGAKIRDDGQRQPALAEVGTFRLKD
jgi:hypothetical protein